MKKLLFSTFLFLLSFILINTYNAKARGESCYLSRSYKNLSTKNILDKLSYNEIKNIKKICTDYICTYSLDFNYKKLLSDHEVRYSSRIKDNNNKENIYLKGIKIDTIYFKDCIY